MEHSPQPSEDLLPVSAITPLSRGTIVKEVAYSAGGFVAAAAGLVFIASALKFLAEIACKELGLGAALCALVSGYIAVICWTMYWPFRGLKLKILERKLAKCKTQHETIDVLARITEANLKLHRRAAAQFTRLLTTRTDWDAQQILSKTETAVASLFTDGKPTGSPACGLLTLNPYALVFDSGKLMDDTSIVLRLEDIERVSGFLDSLIITFRADGKMQTLYMMQPLWKPSFGTRFYSRWCDKIETAIARRKNVTNARLMESEE